MMLKKTICFVVVLMISLLSLYSYQKIDTNQIKIKLIPREVLFGNPDRTNVQISPDGNYISYVAPYKGVLNLYIAKAGDLQNAKLITKDNGRVTNYDWTYNCNYMIFNQDTKGDEDFHLYKIDLKDNSVVDLTPFKGVSAYLKRVSYKNPDTIIVAMNKRDSQYDDLYKLDLKTNKLTLLYENSEKFAGFLIDDEYNLRFAAKTDKNGGKHYVSFDQNHKFSKVMDVPPEDLHNTGLIGFNKTNDKLFYRSSMGRNTSALISWDLYTNKPEVLYENEKVDVDFVMSHPTEKTLQAVSCNYDKSKKHFFDKDIEKYFQFLEKQHSGTVYRESTSLDGKIWVVRYIKDDKPVSYYLFDLQNKKLTFLFKSRGDLDKYTLSKVHPVEIKTRDGLTMMCYLTLPLDESRGGGGYIPKKPLPR